MMYLHRHIEPALSLLAKHSKIVLVLGARQVGKSTLLKQAFPAYPHITFDAFRDDYNVKDDPDLFLKQFNTPLILDEVQYQPALISALKRKVDTSEQAGQYFLTGSQNFSVLKGIAESLAGRVAIINLHPMTPHEMHKQPKAHWLSHLLEDPAKLPEKMKHCLPLSTWEFLWQGGFPGLFHLPHEVIAVMLQSYIQTYLERDVRMIENIRDLGDFRRFVQILAALTGQEINLTQLGREIGISHTTAQRWLTLLTHTYQWNEIPPYHANTLKRISKKPKGVLSDTGLAAHLLHLTTPNSLGGYAQLGALFESSVINQIIAASTALSTPPALYHWRANNGVQSAEVDIILEQDGCLFPIEVKHKSSVSKKDAKGFEAFRAAYPNHQKIKPGVIIYAGDRCFWLTDNVIALPFHAVF